MNRQMIPSISAPFLGIRRVGVLLCILLLVIITRQSDTRKHKRKREKDDEETFTPQEEQRKRVLDNALGIEKVVDEGALFGGANTREDESSVGKSTESASAINEETTGLLADQNVKFITGPKKGRTPGYIKLLIKKQKEEEADRIARGLGPTDPSILQLQLQKQATLIEKGGNLRDLSIPRILDTLENIHDTRVESSDHARESPASYVDRTSKIKKQIAGEISSRNQQLSPALKFSTPMLSYPQTRAGDGNVPTPLAVQIAELKALDEKLMNSHSGVIQHDMDRTHNLRVNDAIVNFLNKTQIHREVGLFSPTIHDFAATGFNPEWNLFHLRHVCVGGGTDGFYMGNIHYLDSSDTYFKDSFTIDTWNAMVDEAGQSPLKGKLFEYSSEHLKVRHVKGSTYFANCMQKKVDSRDKHQSKLLSKLGTLFELAKTYETNSDKTFGSTVFSEALKLPFAQIFLHQCGDPEGMNWSKEVIKVVFNHLKQAELIPAELKSPLTRAYDTRTDAQVSHLICFEDLYLSTRSKWWIQGLLNQRLFRHELMTNLRQFNLLSESVDEEHDHMITDGHLNYCPTFKGEVSNAKIMIFQFDLEYPSEYDGNFLNLQEVVNMVQSFSSVPVKVVTMNSTTPITIQTTIFNSFDLLITPSGDHLSNGILTIKPHSKAVIEVVPFLSDNSSFYNYQYELGFADYVVSSGHLTPHGGYDLCPFKIESDYRKQGCYIHKVISKNKLRQSILRCHNDSGLARDCKLQVNIQFLRRHITLLMKKKLCKSSGDAANESLDKYSFHTLGNNTTTSLSSKYHVNRTEPRTSTVSVEDNAVVNDDLPLIWVSSIQDVFDQFNFIRRIWSVALSHGRSIAIVSYAFKNETLQLCDFYNFPKTIQCSTLSAMDILRSKKCTRFNMDGMDPSIAYQPAVYGLTGEINLAALPVIDWSTAECVVGIPVGKEFTAGIDEAKSGTLVPNFNLRAKELFSKAMAELGMNVDNKYTAVHWIRKDPLVKPCKDMHNMESNSVFQINCGTVENFVNTIRKVLTPAQIEEVYVATSEANREELKKLRFSGLKVLNAGKYVYTPLLKYIIDVQAMVNAHTLVTWIKNSSTKNLVLSCKLSSEQEPPRVKIFDSLEIRVGGLEVPPTNLVAGSDIGDDGDEISESMLRKSEIFLDLDIEGDSGVQEEGHQFFNHPWEDVIIKAIFNSTAIILFIVLLFSYCIYDMISSRPD